MKRNERGIALITALFALLLLTGIGLGLLYMSDAETLINANYRASQQAYFGALAGLQNVRERMTPSNVAPHLISTVGLAAPGNSNSIRYIVAANGITPTANGTDPDNQIASEYANVTGGTPAANYFMPAPYTIDDTSGMIGNANYVPPYRWVRIEQKVNGSNYPYVAQSSYNSANRAVPICWNGANEFPLTETSDPTCSTGTGSDPPGHTPVYLLTSYAAVNNASRYLQMEVAIDPPIVTHGAMDSADHVTLNGNLTVNGYDYCTCQCTTTGSGSNKTTTCTNPSNPSGYYSSTCDKTHNAIYSASSVDNPTNSETVIAGTNPPIVQNQPWTWNVGALYQKYSTQQGAVNVTTSPYNWNCSSGCGTQSSVTLGTLPTNFPPSPPTNTAGMNYQITVVPSDLKITNDASQGAGILLVNGNLEINGGFQYYGLIIVTGTITFSGGGSHPANIVGGIIAGQHSVANLDNTLSGGVNISFDYCALPQSDNTQPPRSLALRDINF